MSAMGGNPHYRNLAKGYAIEDELDAGIVNTEATLAIAYEQRTANLLEFLKLGYVDFDHEGDYLRDIGKRLGLGEVHE